MAYNNIEVLLNKYWEGETTLQEEITLHEYFNNGNVEEKLKPYQPLFQFFKEEKQEGITDKDFDEKVLAALEQPKIQPRRKRKWRTIAKIAASIVIIFSIGFWLLQAPITKNYAKKSPCGELSPTECKEALQALKDTRSALLFVSNKLNQGAKKAAKGLDKLKQIEER